jgi:hypothetical protein
VEERDEWELNSKKQIPNPKQAPNSNYQRSKVKKKIFQGAFVLEIGIWDLGLSIPFSDRNPSAVNRFLSFLADTVTDTFFIAFRVCA